MKPNAVVWFEIYVRDIDRAKKFYETVLATQLQKLNAAFEGIELWAFASDQAKYGAGGALVKMQGREPSGVSAIIYFASDDCAIEQARIEGAGGKIDRPKMSIGEYGFICLATDTEGNMFGVHSMK